MFIKFSSITLFILCHVICLADVPGNQKKTGTLTVKQAAEMVKKANETRQCELDLSWLTSIDQDVARELSHYGGQRLLLDGLTSITQEVAHELTKVQPGRFGWYKKGMIQKHHGKVLVSMVCLQSPKRWHANWPSVMAS